MEATPAQQLVSDLSHASERYAKLGKLFQEFCVKSTELLTANDSPVQGIALSPDTANNRLNVHFCGRLYQFDFTMIYETSKGLVTCRLASREPQVPSTDVGSFTFVGTGDTDVSNGGDLLRIDSKGDAAHLLLHLLYQDVKPAN